MMVRTSSLLAAILAVLVFAACSNDKEAATGSSSSNAAADDATTVSATVESDATDPEVSAAQLDFFSERYISADERLLRRQQRIEQELSRATPGSS